MDVMAKHKSKFGQNFSDNKKALDQVSIIRSKCLKNEIAGYIARYIKHEIRDADIRRAQQEEKVIADATVGQADDGDTPNATSADDASPQATPADDTSPQATPADDTPQATPADDTPQATPADDASPKATPAENNETDPLKVNSGETVTTTAPPSSETTPSA